MRNRTKRIDIYIKDQLLIVNLINIPFRMLIQSICDIKCTFKNLNEQINTSNNDHNKTLFENITRKWNYLKNIVHMIVDLCLALCMISASVLFLEYTAVFLYDSLVPFSIAILQSLHVNETFAEKYKKSIISWSKNSISFMNIIFNLYTTSQFILFMALNCTFSTIFIYYMIRICILPITKKNVFSFMSFLYTFFELDFELPLANMWIGLLYIGCILIFSIFELCKIYKLKKLNEKQKLLFKYFEYAYIALLLAFLLGIYYLSIVLAVKINKHGVDYVTQTIIEEITALTKAHSSQTN